MGKLRIRDRNVPAEYDLMTYSDSNGVETENPGYQKVSEHVEHISDYVHPNYQSRINAGEIINSPCSYKRSDFKAGGGGNYATYSDSNNPGFSYTLSGGSQTIKRLGDTPLAGDYIGDYLDDHIAIAKQKALANMQVSPYAFGEDLFEVRETIKFLRHPLEQLSKLAKSFDTDKRRIRHKSLKKKYGDRATALAGLWSQYRFAATPLVYSTLEAAQALKSGNTVSERLTARGFSRYRDSFESYGNSGTNDRFSYRFSGIYEVDASAGILYEVQNPIMDWRTKYGLRIRDLPHTLWQVVPYSFMVDRFINLSDSLDGMKNLTDPNLKILAAWSRYKAKQVRSHELLNDTPGGSWSCTMLGDEVELDEFWYNRKVWRPSVLDTTPTLNMRGLVSDVTKTVDLLALTLQRFKF